MTPQYLRYFVHLTINSLPPDTFPPYELSKAEYEYLTRYIFHRMTEDDRQDPPPAFIWFETMHGLNILASEDDVDMLRFSTELSSTPPPPPPDEREPEDRDDEMDDDEDEEYDETGTRGRVELYLRGRREPIISSTLDEPEEIGMYLPLMDSQDWDELTLDEEFMYFTDDDGEGVAVRLRNLVLLIGYPGSIKIFGGDEDEEGGLF